MAAGRRRSAPATSGRLGVCAAGRDCRRRRGSTRSTRPSRPGAEGRRGSVAVLPDRFRPAIGAELIRQGLGAGCLDKPMLGVGQVCVPFMLDEPRLPGELGLGRFLGGDAAFVVGAAGLDDPLFELEEEVRDPSLQPP